MSGIVGEDNGAAGGEAFVVFNIIDACEGVDGVHAEYFAELCFRKAVCVRVDVFLVTGGDVQKFVTDFVGGVGELDNKIVAALGDGGEHGGETVAGEYGEYDTEGAAAEFGADVLGDLAAGGVIALRAADDRLGDRDDIAVVQGEAVSLGGVEQTIADERDQVVSLFKYRCYDSSGDNPGVWHGFFLRPADDSRLCLAGEARMGIIIC